MARVVPGSGWLEHIPSGLEEVLAGAGSLLSHGSGCGAPWQRQAGKKALLTETPVPNHSAGKQRSFGMLLAHSL